MSKPITIPNAFATQPGPIPLIQLDNDFTTCSGAINDLATYANYFVDSSGAANQITVTVNPPLTVSYTAGLTLQIKIANTNTSTAVNINVNALGNISVVNPDGSLPLSGQFTAGGIYSFQYEAVTGKFQALTPSRSQSVYSAFKTADLTRSSSTASFDPDLQISVPSAGYYFVDAYVQTGVGGASVVFGLNFTGTFSAESSYGGATGGFGGATQVPFGASGSATYVSALQTASTQVQLRGILIATGAGTFGYSWGSSVNLTNVVVLAGSNIRLTRLG